MDNLKGMLKKIKTSYGQRTAFRIKVGREELRDISYDSFTDDINALGSALINLGLKGKHIAVLSENRYEWITSYLAVICGTGTVVPIDRDLPEDSINYLLKVGDISAVICSSVYEEIVSKTDTLDFKISFDKENDGDGFLSFKKLISKGKDLIDGGGTAFEKTEINPDEMSCILFTSGTTGFSKGVMLSHKNIAGNLLNATVFEKYRENEIMLSVLPYHHAFECTVGLLASLYYGATICINDSLKYFAKNLALFKPTSMFLVPAIIYAIYKRIADAEKNLGRSLTAEEAQGVMGGRLSRIFSGGAPLNPKLILVFKNYGVRLCQGYGLTETSPVVATIGFDRLNEDNLSSVGQIIPECEVKIKDGEILVKGSNVMLGYYKNTEATAEAFDEEWFKTGDLGKIDENGFLYINGRKKNVIIASGGENVYPEEIEQLLYGIPFLSDAVVYGDSSDSDSCDTVTAVIYPNYDLLSAKSAEEIKKDVDMAIQNINEKLPLYKQILKIKIRKTPFEKTTSNKVKRNQSNTEEI